MRHLLTVIVCLLLGFSNSYGQLNETFNGGTLVPFDTDDNWGDIPDTWTGIDVDENKLYFGIRERMDGKAWRTHILSEFGGDTVVVAASLFTPLGQTADDWLITPKFMVPNVSGSDKVYMSWEGYALSDADPEPYDVLLSTTGKTPSDFDTKLLSVASENTEGFKVRGVDITNYQGQEIYIAYNYKATDGFYIYLDDFEVKTISTYDVEIKDVSINRYQKTDESNQFTGKIFNWGKPITQMDVVWDDGSGPQTMTLTDLNIPTYAEYDFTHDIGFMKSTVDEYVVDVSIENINGSEDDINPSNNSASLYVSTIANNAKRNMLVEMGTGTWCGYCPRGIVAFHQADSLITDGSFIGVEVHLFFNDPMIVQEYETGVELEAAPSINIDRHPSYKRLDVFPGTPEFYHDIRVKEACAATVGQDVTYDPSTRQLVINASATFHTDVSTGLRFGSIIVEDNVTGDDDYSQANNFSGDDISMGGFEDLPITIFPFWHDHVGRVLIGGYSGQTGSIPADVSNDDMVNHTFTYTLPDYILPENMKIVTVVIDEKDGQILNAIQGGFTTIVSNNNISKSGFNCTVYPTPNKTGELFIDIDGDYTTDLLNINLTSLNGIEIYGESLGLSSTNESISFKIPTTIPNGNYFLNISRDGSTVVKQITLMR